MPALRYEIYCIDLYYVSHTQWKPEDIANLGGGDIHYETVEWGVNEFAYNALNQGRHTKGIASKYLAYVCTIDCCQLYDLVGLDPRKPS